MSRFRPNDPPDAARSFPIAPREIFRDAVRYWEPRRITYNAVLAALAAAWVAATWPHFRPTLTAESLLLVFALAAIANACYCAAYVAEFAMQLSSLRTAWLKWRWILWLAGTLIAGALTYYWIADEIYPYVGIT
jgi:hypothetical protein